MELKLRSDDGSEAVTVDYATEHDARFTPLGPDAYSNMKFDEPDSSDLPVEYKDGPAPKTKGEVWQGEKIGPVRSWKAKKVEWLVGLEERKLKSLQDGKDIAKICEQIRQLNLPDKDVPRGKWYSSRVKEYIKEVEQQEAEEREYKKKWDANEIAYDK